MKVCYIGDAGDIHVQKWLKYFADNGNDVHIISQRSFADDGIDLDIKNVSLRLLGKIPATLKLVSSLVNLIWSIIQVRRIIGKIKPDIFHVQYIGGWGFLGALSGFHPLLMTAFGSDIFVAPKKSRINKLTIEYALRKADIILTTSVYLKSYLHTEFRLPEHKVRIVPWGIDLKVFHKGYDSKVVELRRDLKIDANSFVVFSPRLLMEWAQVKSIVEAMPYVLAKYPNVILVLLKSVGKNTEYEQSTDNLAKKLGVSQNIRLIRRVFTPEEMAVMNNTSDVSISIPKSDQFASSIMEAMVCGAIPIVGDLEVYRQYLTDGENAFIVNPKDPGQIAETIIYCIEHPEVKEKFYTINKRIIEEKEDWNKNAYKMKEIYAEFIE
ncbi:glycosyltransferase family 4 protein [Chloroflexota bacterium]